MSNIESTKGLSNDVERTQQNFDTLKKWLHLKNQGFGTTGIAMMQVSAAVETSELNDLKAAFDLLIGTKAAQDLRSLGKNQDQSSDQYYYAFVSGCLLAALEIIKKNRTKSPDKNDQSSAIGDTNTIVRTRLSETTGDIS